MMTPASPRQFSRATWYTGLLFVAALIAWAAPSIYPQPLVKHPGTAGERGIPAAMSSPAGCLGAEAAATVWPQLSDIQPQPAAPGGQVTATGSGGFVQCGASAINESARSFRLDLDGVAVGSISCYVNHCEGNFTLPVGVAAGPHVVTVEGGSQLSLDVALPRGQAAGLYAAPYTIR